MKTLILYIRIVAGVLSLTYIIGVSWSFASDMRSMKPHPQDYTVEELDRIHAELHPVEVKPQITKGIQFI